MTTEHPLIPTPRNHAMAALIDSMVDGDKAFRTYETERFRADLAVAMKFVSSDDLTEADADELPDIAPRSALLYLYDKNSGLTARKWISNDNHIDMLGAALEKGDDRGIAEGLEDSLAFDEVKTEDSLTLYGRAMEAYGSLKNAFKRLTDREVDQFLDNIGSTKFNDLDTILFEGKPNERRDSGRLQHEWHPETANIEIKTLLARPFFMTCLVRDGDKPDWNSYYRTEYVTQLSDNSHISYEYQLEKRRINAASQWVKATLTRCLSDRLTHGMTGERLSESYRMIEPYLDSAAYISYLEPEKLKTLGKLTPEAFRNRMQILDLAHGNIAAWDRLMKIKEISVAADEGKPLKEALGRALPLANTSKGSVQKLFQNLATLSHWGGSSSIVPSKHLKPAMHWPLCTEKNILQISHDRDWRILHEIHKNDLPFISATLATLPEKSLFGVSGDDLDRLSMDQQLNKIQHLSQVHNFPGAKESIMRTCELHRTGQASMSVTLAWMERMRSTNTLVYRYSDLQDGYKILNESFSMSLIAHALDEHNKRHPERQINGPPNHAQASNAYSIISGLAERVNYGTVLDIASEAHKAFQRVARLGDVKGSATWNPAIDEPFKQKRLEIVPLYSSLALHEEGQALSHCVGTYVRKAMEGDSLIFSVREEGKPISTLEIEHVYGEFSLAQHQGYDNSDPCPEACEIVQAFMAAVDSEEIKLNAETGVTDEKLQHLTMIEKWEITSGISASNPRVIGAIMDEWKRLMPGTDPWALENARELFGEEFSSTVDSLRETYEQRHRAEFSVA